MRGSLVVFVLLAAVLPGCTHTHTVRPTYPGERAKLNDRNVRDKGTIVLQDGERLLGEGLHCREDSTVWRDVYSRERQIVPTPDLHEVRYNSKGKGAWEGTWMGAAIGLALGVVTGLSSGDDEDSYFNISAEGKAVLLGIAYGTIGGLTGLVIGAAKGRDDVYRIDHRLPETTNETDSTATEQPEEDPFDW
jgi:hypothetical protein